MAIKNDSSVLRWNSDEEKPTTINKLRTVKHLKNDVLNFYLFSI